MDEHVADYPEAVVRRIPAFALGRAFFPAGAGRWTPGTPLPPRPVMLVAHVFDEASVAYALGPGGGSERTEGNRTWLGLRALLARAGLDPERCFLTNALMGAKRGDPCGRVAGGAPYRRACERYLAAQVAAVAPALVATLGTPAMLALRGASADLAGRWAGLGGIAALDAASPPRLVERDVAIGGVRVPGVVALGHPCAWAGGRRFAGERGARGDAALLRAALAGSRARAPSAD